MQTGMKTIQITSTGYCEVIQNFIVTDETYERVISEISLLKGLDFDEKTEALIKLYGELGVDAKRIENIKYRQLDIPEVINVINCQ
jgi:hypothetical protein